MARFRKAAWLVVGVSVLGLSVLGALVSGVTGLGQVVLPRNGSVESIRTEELHEFRSEGATEAGPDQSSNEDMPLQSEVDTEAQRGGDDPLAVSRSGQYLDINSGDVWGSRTARDGLLKYGVSESPLSREVRRLGIPVPETRKWVVISAGPSGGVIYGMLAYHDILPWACRLLDLLEKTGTPDDERRHLLEMFMTSLRAETPFQAQERLYRLILQICDQHGLESMFTPEFTEHLRQSRSREP